MYRAATALAFLLLAVSLPAAAQLYKIVGADGKVSYSDKPPVDPKGGKVTEFKVESYSGPPQIDQLAAKPDWAAILRRPAAAGGAASGLVLFSAEWCGPCKKAKQYMDEKRIAYSNIDIDKDAQGKAEYKKLGGHGIPFFVRGDKTLTGFSSAKLDSFLSGS